MNKLFSLITMPGFIGMPGFVSKSWFASEKTGYSMGIYEWETIADAERYSKSFAMRFMKKRSAPGSVSFEITDIDPKS